jgi:uncharacterized protein (DUF2147 family)
MKIIPWYPVALQLALCLATPAAAQVQAAPAEPMQGLWLAEPKDGVVEFKPCTDEPSSMCGTVVWHKNAAPDKPGNCGLLIAKLRSKVDDVWRDGWVHDPRVNKNYKGALRLKGKDLALRAYIGEQDHLSRK